MIIGSVHDIIGQKGESYKHTHSWKAGGILILQLKEGKFEK